VTPRLLLRLEVVRFALTSSSDASSRGRPDPRDSQGDMNSDSRTAYGLSPQALDRPPGRKQTVTVSPIPISLQTDDYELESKQTARAGSMPEAVLLSAPGQLLLRDFSCGSHTPTPPRRAESSKRLQNPTATRRRSSGHRRTPGCDKMETTSGFVSTLPRCPC
jgi:hypothetical protein